MKNSDLIIHIGLHKTGTTFLQENLFSEFKTLQLVRGWDTLRRIISLDSTKKILISDEGLSGKILGGSYLEDFYRNIKMIKKLFGDPKIIIGFRHHSDFILSVYKQYLHIGGFKDFSYIYNINGSGIIKKEELFFEPRIQHLKDNFSHVFVYTQDSLKDRLTDFLDSFQSFADVNEVVNIEKIKNKKSKNIGVRSVLQINTLRNINYILDKVEKIPLTPNFYSTRLMKWNLTPRNFCQNFLKEIKSKEYKLDQVVKNQIEILYKSDWSKIEKHLSY